MIQNVSISERTLRKKREERESEGVNESLRSFPFWTIISQRQFGDVVFDSSEKYICILSVYMDGWVFFFVFGVQPIGFKFMKGLP